MPINARHTATPAIVKPNPAIRKVGFVTRPLRPVKPPVQPELRRSELEIYDIPIELLVDSEENANEQDEATFDQLTQGIAEEGIDEPCIVMPVADGPNAGKFIIVSGHHRKKVAVIQGLKVVPCVIKKGWTDDRRLVELVRRNNLRGTLNPEKFVKLFQKMVQKGHDRSVLKLQMGFTKGEIFDKMFKQVEKNLTPTQKKKLIEAKERVTSVESFSTVLNEIFTEHGNELDHGLICFKYGDKNKKDVYYVECDEALHHKMKKFNEEIQERGLHASDVFNEILKNVDWAKMPKSNKVAARKELRKVK